MSDHYILKGKTPVPVDMMTWAKWLETNNTKRKVAHDVAIDGTVKVSTVFLGLDHSFGGGPALIFETMIFGGEHDQWQDRCSTWEQAEEMHRKACAMAGIPTA